MARPALPMTPLDPTRTKRRPTFRRTSRPDAGTRGEVWEATSTDGVWTYLRMDEPGTPWATRHNPTGRVLWCTATSLRAARIDTASGWTLTELGRRCALVQV